MSMDYEKLGAFYPGKVFDAGANKRSADPLLYDSRDLITHRLRRQTGIAVGKVLLLWTPSRVGADGFPSSAA